MDCKDIKALLSGLMDGRLDAAAQHEAERHLAGCADCRTLIDRAEQVEFSLGRSMQSEAGAALPTGFVEFVLGQTSRSPTMRSGRWTNYFGWVAAAASLALALTIWVMDRRTFIQHDAARELGGTESSGGLGASRNVMSTAYAPGRELRSFVLEALPDALPQSVVGQSDPITEQRESPHGNGPRAPAIVPVAHAYTMLKRDDSEALMTASMLLDHLSQSTSDSFITAERIRQTAEYERLVPQLREMRDQVAVSDRASVYAAETVFRRLVDGPLSLEDLGELRRAAGQLQLSETMHDLAAAEVAANSL